MTTHARLSASSAERWWNCPGSIRQSQGITPKSSPHAREGTAAHHVVEIVLTGKKPSLDACRYSNVEVEGELIFISDEMLDAVRVYTDYCNDLRNRGAVTWVEQQFDLSKLNPPEPMFGTADFVAWFPEERTLEIVDLKYGSGVVVEAKWNKQELIYALGAVLKLGKRPKRIISTIVQPRAPHPEGAIRSCLYEYEYLQTFKAALLDAAKATQAPDAPLSAGSHCRFCPALARCPEQMKLVKRVAADEFEAEAPVALVAPSQLTQEQLLTALHYADLIEEWLGSVRAHVTEQLEAGRQVPGWKLVDKRAVRRWRDEEEAKEAMERVLGEDAYRKVPLSPAQAEAALKKLGYKLPEELVEKVSSGKKLAPDSDPRPARLPSAVEDFAD